MNAFGKNLRISIFGESHGSVVGITIDGLPAGVSLNHQRIKETLTRRSGRADISTPRRENDDYKIISGYFEEHTTGAPLTIVIPNNKFDSSPYKFGNVRPGHADLPLYKKFNGAHDYHGGGHSSGRLTAPLVILGAICEEFLNQKGVIVASRIFSIRNTKDMPIDFEQVNVDLLLKLKEMDFPVLDRRAYDLMINSIKKAKENRDSVGGIVETFVYGCPAGVGEPFFNSVESYISHLMFSIPGIKGIEFGLGFKMAEQFGSKVNDQLEWRNDNLRFFSNFAGGINGGITNGNLLQFKVVVRPTSSIEKPQQSVNIVKGTDYISQTTGKHDPCLVHRALPVIEALTNYAILDLLWEVETR